MDKSNEFKCRLFTRGKTVWHFGQAYIVDHVTIRGNLLFINFEGGMSYIPDYQVECQPTVLSLTRKKV